MSDVDESHIAGLWIKIDGLHTNFLHFGIKSDNLEGLVVEYLSLVPQDRRFNSATTGDIIANSAKYKPDFSLIKAENAFRAMEAHAANLIRRWGPRWRESLCIQKHSGFYKNSVQSALSDPDKLFLEMGYYPSEGELYIAQAMVGGHFDVDIDLVVNVARDCLLAYVECYQLAGICRGVMTQCPITLNEVIEFRRNHIGYVEDCVRELVFQKKIRRKFQLSATPTTPLNGAKNSSHSDPQNLNNDWDEVVADIKVNVERQLDVKRINYEKLENKKTQVDNEISEKENLLFLKEVQIFKDTKKMAKFKEDEEILKKSWKSLQEEKENCMKESSDANDRKVELVNEVKSLYCQKTKIESRLKSFKEVSLDKDETRKILLSLIQEKVEDLECPVCLVEATAPIFSCKEMHLICSSCSERIAAADNKCPVCRGSYGSEKMRHRFAEKMSEKLGEMRKSLADMRLTTE